MENKYTPCQIYNPGETKLNGYLHVKNKKNCATILSWSTDNGSIKIKDLISGGLWSGAQFVLDEVVGCDMQMPPNSYIYDVQIYKSKNTSTYFKGTMSVSGDVTRVVDCDCNYSGGTALDVGDSYCYMVDSFSAYRMWFLKQCVY